MDIMRDRKPHIRTYVCYSKEEYIVVNIAGNIASKSKVSPLLLWDVVSTKRTTTSPVPSFRSVSNVCVISLGTVL